MMSTETFNTDMVLGFFDADGGIEAKVSLGTTKPVSFHVNVILSQKDRSVIKQLPKAAYFLNNPLLEAVREFLQSKGVHLRDVPIRNFQTYAQLFVTGVEDCLQLVDLFDALGAEQHFSEVRLNQYRCFSQAIKLYTNPSFRRDYNMCYRFLQLKWEMNPGTTDKREGSFADDVAKLDLWFHRPRRNKAEKTT